MLGGVRAEAAERLLQLALAADLLPAACLVPGDGDVHEALEEAALGRRCGPPGVFEHLVPVVEASRADQLEPARELSAQRVRGRPSPRRDAGLSEARE